MSNINNFNEKNEGSMGKKSKKIQDIYHKSLNYPTFIICYEKHLNFHCK